MSLSTRAAQALGVPPGMRFYFVYVGDAYSGWIRGYDRAYAARVARQRLGHLGKVTLREASTASAVRRLITKPVEDIERNPAKSKTPVVGVARRYARAAKRMLRGKRRRNPIQSRGRSYDVTLRGTRIRFFQGYVEDVRYTRAEDGKPYSHVVESDAAELYLCDDPTYGKCLLIVDPSGKTPLWG